MNQIVVLDYTFLFDPASGWQHLYQFENDLANFFAAYGCEALISKVLEGQPNKRIVYIKRLDSFDVARQTNKEEKFHPPQDILKEMMKKPQSTEEKEFKKGKISRGILKR